VVGRRIVSRSLQAGGQESVDSYAARIVKYVPADIISGWIAVTALLPGTDRRMIAVLWLVFAAMLGLTPFWVSRATRVPDQPVARTQIVVSTVAFAVWVFATGPPFSYYGFYAPAFGGVALVLFTLATGAIDPGRTDSRAR
jgi:hypothetical protein